MSREQPFEEHSLRYDAWFDEHRDVYEAELAAVASLIEPGAKAVEVGVGTGRFASRLGIHLGVEPSARMARLARARGVEVSQGCAEDLPLPDAVFDLVLMVTAICFFDDVDRAFREARRVLKDSGSIVVAFMDADSALGRFYQERKAKNVFYADATFYSVPDVTARLGRAGFTGFEYRQTLFGPDASPAEPIEGFGAGGFVVIRARVQPAAA